VDSPNPANAAPARPADVPRGTLTALFFGTVDEWDKPDALLGRSGGDWTPISHRGLLDTVRWVSAGLRGLGVGRGDRVGLLSENRTEWAMADFGTLCAGALDVPFYPTLPAGQVAEIARHAGVTVAFVSTAAQLAKMLEVRGMVPALETVIVFDEVADRPAGVLTFRELVEAGKARDPGENRFRQEALATGPEDVATIIYTSGTTGEPKGVMLTHDNLYSNVVAGLAEFSIGPADIALSFLPLSHVFQRMVDYAMFSRGCTIAYVSSIDEVGPAFRAVRPTIAAAAPRVYEKLYARILSAKGLKRRLVLWARAVALDWSERRLAGRPVPAGLRVAHRLADRLVYGKIRATLGGRMRIFISGSAPLAPQLARFFYGAGLVIYEGYGLTETSPVTNVNTPKHLRIGTVGLPIKGTEIRVAADGEILVRGPQVMKGYYRSPEATAAAITPDGWFHTGDIGEIDADGYLRITDRKKDLLVTAGGKNIAPQPIQNAVKQSRFISEAVLIGDRRPYPIALVVPNFDSLESWAHEQGLDWVDMEALLALPAVRRKLEEEVARRTDGLARFETPKKVLPLPRELSLEKGEVTPTLKVKRRVVEEHFREAIEALYAEPGPGAD
jgi:long-chain acyl-CoA synthetase